MQPWKNSCHKPAPGAGDDSDPSSDNKQEIYLAQAREQRARLMDTPNGQKLMGLYNEHNEVYDEAFKNQALLRRHWKAEGATANMADDTHQAIKNNDVVNKKDKKYKNGLGYNANAFTQQLNVAVGTAMSESQF